jgi:hypothetical protein
MVFSHYRIRYQLFHIALILLAIFVVSVTACSKEKNSTQNNTNTITERIKDEKIANNKLHEPKNYSSLSSVISNNFIVFMNNYTAGNIFIAAYKYHGTNNFYDYKENKPIRENFDEDPIWYLDTQEGILVLDEGTHSNPHNIYFIDLENNNDLTNGLYQYPNDYRKISGKVFILDYIGKTLDKEQEKRLDMNQYREQASQIIDTNLKLSYYEEYYFNLETREIEDLNVIFIKAED